jgi:hypothetical protein
MWSLDAVDVFDVVDVFDGFATTGQKLLLLILRSFIFGLLTFSNDGEPKLSWTS